MPGPSWLCCVPFPWRTRTRETVEAVAAGPQSPAHIGNHVVTVTVTEAAGPRVQHPTSAESEPLVMHVAPKEAFQIQGAVPGSNAMDRLISQQERRRLAACVRAKQSNIEMLDEVSGHIMSEILVQLQHLSSHNSGMPATGSTSRDKLLALQEERTRNRYLQEAARAEKERACADLRHHVRRVGPAAPEALEPAPVFALAAKTHARHVQIDLTKNVEYEPPSPEGSHHG